MNIEELDLTNKKDILYELMKSNFVTVLNIKIENNCLNILSGTH